MADTTPCQRPDCDQPGKVRTMLIPKSRKTVRLNLCDEDYREACDEQRPPRWLGELLTHLGLVG